MAKFNSPEEAIDYLDWWADGAKEIQPQIAKLYDMFALADTHEAMEDAISFGFNLWDRYYDYGSDGHSDAMQALVTLFGEKESVDQVHLLPEQYWGKLSPVADWKNQLKDIADYYEYSDYSQEFRDNLLTSDEMESLLENVQKLKDVPGEVADFKKQYEDWVESQGEKSIMIKSDYTLNIRTLEKFVNSELAEMGLEDFEAVEDETKEVEDRYGDVYDSTHIVTIYADYDEWVEWWGNPQDATDHLVWLDTLTSEYDFVIEPIKIQVEEDSIVAEFYFSESY